MAKIFGVELKNVREGFGHDGAGMQASIYVDGKRIGVADDDGWGGGVNISFVDNKHQHVQEYEDLFESRMKAYFAKHPSEFETWDIFLFEILQLRNLEKSFKSMIKRGRYKVFVYAPAEHFLDRPNRRAIAFECADVEAAKDAMVREKRTDYTIYQSVDDFVIESK